MPTELMALLKYRRPVARLGGFRSRFEMKYKKKFLLANKYLRKISRHLKAPARQQELYQQMINEKKL